MLETSVDAALSCEFPGLVDVLPIGRFLNSSLSGGKEVCVELRRLWRSSPRISEVAKSVRLALRLLFTLAATAPVVSRSCALVCNKPSKLCFNCIPVLAPSDRICSRNFFHCSSSLTTCSATDNWCSRTAMDLTGGAFSASSFALIISCVDSNSAPKSSWKLNRELLRGFATATEHN